MSSKSQRQILRCRFPVGSLLSFFCETIGTWNDPKKTTKCLSNKAKLLFSSLSSSFLLTQRKRNKRNLLVLPSPTTRHIRIERQRKCGGTGTMRPCSNVLTLHSLLRGLRNVSQCVNLFSTCGCDVRNAQKVPPKPPLFNFRIKSGFFCVSGLFFLVFAFIEKLFLLFM